MIRSLNHVPLSFAISIGFLLCSLYSALCLHAQIQSPEDEIVANLAGGRVIVHVARDGEIVFAAIDHPVEAGGVPPRVVELDSTHVAVLLGASEWRLPADPQPVRLDRDFQRITARDPKYQYNAGEAEPDLETIGIAFLEKLRPLVAQLHHKIDLRPDEPLFEMVLIGYGSNNYGPEVWTVEYRVQQEQVATRGEYWQTRILRPRFTKVLDAVDKGQAQKVVPTDAADFLRAALPLIAGKEPFILAKMEEQHGFDWIVPPDEPIEKAKKEDKNRPPEAPTLRRRPNPNPNH